MPITSSIFGTYCLRLLGYWGVLHGLLTCLGGTDRWQSHVYDVVRLVPGSPYTWGAILIFAGICILWATYAGVDYQLNVLNKTVNYKSIKNIGLWVMAGWTFIFALGVLTAAAIHPEVSFAGSTRDALICALSIMMTKAKEPRYIK